MIYTKEFNKFFESFDTGNLSSDELEMIKIDMYSGWEGRQFEIDELIEKYETRIRKLKDYIEDLIKEIAEKSGVKVE